MGSRAHAPGGDAGYANGMGKQMEGDNKQRRKNAREEQKKRLANVQHGEAKRGGDDVPKPLRGKGRSRDPEAPPRPG